MNETITNKVLSEMMRRVRPHSKVILEQSSATKFPILGRSDKEFETLENTDFRQNSCNLKQHCHSLVYASKNAETWQTTKQHRSPVEPPGPVRKVDRAV